MSQPTWKLRPATEADISNILGLIKELALYVFVKAVPRRGRPVADGLYALLLPGSYEKAPERVEATEESLRKTLYGARPYAEVVLAVDGETAVGMALFVRSVAASGLISGSLRTSTCTNAFWRVACRAVSQLLDLAREAWYLPRRYAQRC